MSPTDQAPQDPPASKTYIGCKVIAARPLEKDGKPGYEVEYPDGYISWSPKDVFDNAYRLFTPGELSLITG